MQTDAADIEMVKFYQAILIGILAILAFSLFVSAVTMCVASFARSYKEANNYITPLMLVVLFTGYIGFIPNLRKGGVPTVSDVWFVVALTIVLVLYAGGMLQLKFGLAGVFGTQMILLFVPLAVVLYTKKEIRLTYGFQKTGLKSFLGALFVVFGLVPVNIVVSYILTPLFPAGAESVEAMFSTIMDGNAVSVFFVTAMAPAVCEEMLFRGFIYHSMKARYRISVAIGIAAVLFGIYHMSLIRFIPTALAGLIFCCVVYKTGSIYPSMMMHFINNAFNVLAAYYPEKIEKIFPILYKESMSFSDGVLFCSVGMVLLAIGGVIFKRV